MSDRDPHDATSGDDARSGHPRSADDAMSGRPRSADDARSGHPRSGDDAMSAEDARLLAELGRSLGPDAAPPGLVGRAEGLLVFADVDRELAELLDASAAEPAGLRGPAVTGERLVFEISGGSVAVEVVVHRDRVAGQVLAGTVTEVDLEHPTGAGGRATVDDLGRFSYQRPGTGPARLLLWTGSTRPVATDWFLL